MAIYKRKGKRRSVGQKSQGTDNVHVIKRLGEIEDEQNEIRRSRMLTLGISVPSLIYLALGRKPPAILRSLAGGMAVYLIMKNMDKLTEDKTGI